MSDIDALRNYYKNDIPNRVAARIAGVIHHRGSLTAVTSVVVIPWVPPLATTKFLRDPRCTDMRVDLRLDDACHLNGTVALKRHKVMKRKDPSCAVRFEKSIIVETTPPLFVDEYTAFADLVLFAAAIHHYHTEMSENTKPAPSPTTVS